MKNELPKDILSKVAELFPAEPDRNEIIRLIEEIYTHDWGVGKDQLVRALLMLSKGKVDEFKKHSTNIVDPRDTITDATPFIRDDEADDEFPPDIREKVLELFPAETDRDELFLLIEDIYTHDWGVGKDQLVRALLVLSEGNANSFKDRSKNMEPRDLIMEAEAMLGNPGHYFLEPFD
ncbi:hypothetical protein [Fluviicola sp.]|uniref:hypothetical protein n=1 Tax=Fluviicola sp. TaxID=1917219 RepID=UPI0031DC163F